MKHTYGIIKWIRMRIENLYKMTQEIENINTNLRELISKIETLNSLLSRQTAHNNVFFVRRNTFQKE